MNMIGASVVSVVVGMAIVVQAGLNRQIAEAWGLPATALFNALFFLAYGLALAAISKWLLPLAPPFAWPETTPTLNWWTLIPGFCGLIIVIGVPWALSSVGALQVFVLVVGIQLTGSLLWDKYYEDIPYSPLRLLGAALAIIGVIVSSWPQPPKAGHSRLPSPTSESRHNRGQSEEP